MTDAIKVLDKGFVRLDSSMADDLSVVRAARVSLANQDAEPDEERDRGLINFLMANKHGTPFEHNALRFHVKCPIFVMREWIRHRIGSFNEWSGRYSVLEPDFYIPDYVRTQVGKPGAYSFEQMADDVAQETRDEIEESCKYAYRAYSAMLEWGVAKETARVVLPVNIYTQFYWTINARSLMNFLSLRTSEHAMFEIREYALRIEDLWAGVMPLTHAAFISNGKVAP